MSRKTSVLKNCQNCNKGRWVQPYLLALGFGNYCSRSCSARHLKAGFKVGHKISEQTKEKIRQALLGRKYPNRQGPNSYLWRGGVSSENELARQSHSYKEWRQLVFERDNYTCQVCGARGGNGKKVILNADHLLPFAIFEESRFEVSNGRTLCEPCHKKTSTYGTNKRFQDSYFLPTYLNMILFGWAYGEFSANFKINL
jgi:hypothetical protein